MYIDIDGTRARSTGFGVSRSYTNTAHEMTINADFTKISFTIVAPTRGTGPNPSMSVCSIAMR